MLTLIPGKQYKQRNGQIVTLRVNTTWPEKIDLYPFETVNEYDDDGAYVGKDGTCYPGHLGPYDLVEEYDSRDEQIRQLKKELAEANAKIKTLIPRVVATHYALVWFDHEKPEDVVTGGFTDHKFSAERLREHNPKATMFGWVKRQKFSDGTYKTEMELADA